MPKIRFIGWWVGLGAGGKQALLQTLVGALDCAVCKCACCVLGKLNKNVRWENKKYRRSGIECRLTRCPVVIWSVCCPPVKVVRQLLSV